jgi:hypothetical protein
MILNKIRAVREDPEHPMADCYPTDVDTLAQLAVAAAIAKLPSNKEQPKMSLNPEYINASARKVEKRSIPIHYAGAAGLVRTLEALGLNPAPQLGSLVASGARLNASGWQVSLDEVDMALARTYASIGERMAFKSALVHHGLMSPRR